jgi:HlyD family secretion protein
MKWMRRASRSACRRASRSMPFPASTFAGRVRRIAPYVLEVEKQARTVEVEVVFTDPGRLQALLVGYSADAEIILESRDKALRVPTQALLDGNRVLVLNNGVLEQRRKLETRSVQLGIQRGAQRLQGR